jgi:arylsulfatase A-like enzyme
VTPNLSRIAAQGVRGAAYAHTPVTWASRASLMQGRVIPAADGSTLVDDFIARGYEVAWFSGQHDEVAGEGARLGIERATQFYDARQDVARRTSRSAQPISLQVSWKTVMRRVSGYLETRDSNAPLFLYVNLVDTHFPYWHAELDDLLGVGALSRAEIRPEHRERVWRAYANAAANVDRAIGEIVALGERTLGESLVVVITADHGQAFYENGMLGHGQALDDAQTRVPLLVRAPGAALPPLVALSDLRGALGYWVDEEPAPGDDGAVLQWVGEVSRARRLGLRRAGEARSVDLRAGSGIGASLDVIRAWEMTRYDAAVSRK